MDLAKLKDVPALLVLAEELHFGRAAVRLGMPQPQLSQIVQRLEREIGVQIFQRRPAVRVTPAGEALLVSAGRALTEVASGIATAQAIAKGSDGTVRLGYAPVAMLTALPAGIQSFRATNPRVAVELVEAHSARLWALLSSNLVDVIVSRECRSDPGIETRELSSEHLVVVVPVDHRCARQRSVKLADFLDDDFVFFSEHAAPQYHRSILGACRKAGLEPAIRQRADGWSSILALVANGFGVSLVSQTLSRIGFPGVVFLELDAPCRVSSFWLSWRAHDQNAAAAALRSRLLDFPFAACSSAI